LDNLGNPGKEQPDIFMRSACGKVEYIYANLFGTTQQRGVNHIEEFQFFNSVACRDSD